MRKLLLILALFIIGCGSHKEEKQCSHPQEEEFRKVLVEMLDQSIDAFVIIEEPITKKFVQFSNKDGDIFFDVPKIALDEAETKRAHKYFPKHDIVLRVDTGIDIETSEYTRIESWWRIFPSDKVDVVVNICIGTFFEVYDLESTSKFIITKGWE
ncbi:MAG: hypothetical protein ACYSWP_10090 [Planctomycetota bacterium]|jgi:hypothetical protein